MNQAGVKRTIDRMTPDDVTTLERQPFFRRTVWKRNALLAAAVLCNLAVLTLVMALHADSQPSEGTVPLLGFHVRLAFDSWQTYFWLFVVVIAQVALGHRQLAQSLRRAGLHIELGYSGNLSRRMQRANKIKARAAVILGDNEIERQVAGVRDLDNGEQAEVPLASLADRLAAFR